MACYEEFAHGKIADRKVLVIGERRFEVSATMLSCQTNYFNTMFTDFNERDKVEVTLDLKDTGVEADDVREFIKQCYPKHDPVNEHNYLKLLRAVSYFGAPLILDEIEKFIISRCNKHLWRPAKEGQVKPFFIDLLKGFQLAVEFHLRTVETHMLKCLGYYRLHTFLRLYPDVLQMDTEIKVKIFDAYAKAIMATQAAAAVPRGAART